MKGFFDDDVNVVDGGVVENGIANCRQALKSNFGILEWVHWTKWFLKKAFWLKVITVIAYTVQLSTHDRLGNSKARNVESPMPEVIHKTLAIVIDFIIDNWPISISTKKYIYRYVDVCFFRDY